MCCYLKTLCNTGHLFLILCPLNDIGAPDNGMKLVGKRIFQVFPVAFKNTPFFGSLVFRLSAVVYNIFSLMLLIVNPDQLSACAA